MQNPKKLLLIFTRNPELGKVKTRLAKDIGDAKALDVYQFLLDHTAAITKDLKVTKQVHYSDTIGVNDVWDSTIFSKKLQEGTDLGIRMQHAFEQGFADGFTDIIIIGSDLHELTEEDIEHAFDLLQNRNTVIGPATDGGFYLLGLKKLIPELFLNKEWGTDTVLKATLNDLDLEDTAILDIRNDVDYLSDIEDIPEFQQFLS